MPHGKALVVPLLGTPWPPMPQPMCAGNGYNISGDLLRFPSTSSTCSLPLVVVSCPGHHKYIGLVLFFTTSPTHASLMDFVPLQVISVSK
jgi:hypothetical protein